MSENMCDHSHGCPTCQDRLKEVEEGLNDAVKGALILQKQKLRYWEALKKHVCVRAMQADRMNGVDYYPVDEDECELCIALKDPDENS